MKLLNQNKTKMSKKKKYNRKFCVLYKKHTQNGYIAYHENIYLYPEENIEDDLIRKIKSKIRWPQINETTITYSFEELPI